MTKNPTAFVSYSWDSKEHQDWVSSIVNELRANGVDATSDFFETQRGTRNLYSMMVENIRDKDYVIVVLTPTYAKKADELQGGVGYETSLLQPLIQENINKIIPILRSNSDFNKSIPFYLKGTHYINFSESSNLKDSFTELLHRIMKIDLIEQVPLGNIPELRPRRVSFDYNKSNGNSMAMIPDLQIITDEDKNHFIKDCFKTIRDELINLLIVTKDKNPNFSFDYDDITSKKIIYKVYINGSQKSALKMWISNGFGRDVSINLSYGNFVTDNDSSMNESIVCEIDDNKKLKLRMLFDFQGTRGPLTIQETIDKVWSKVIFYLQ